MLSLTHQVLPLLFISFVFALPSNHYASRAVRASNCLPATSGTLTSSNGLTGFFVNSENQIEYSKTSKEILELDFEACYPNFGQFEDPIKYGHLVIHSTGQCIGVKSLEGTTFSLAAVPCTYTDHSTQAFQSWLHDTTEGNQFYFPGITQADKKWVHGSDYCGIYNCADSGLFGYTATSSDGTPAEGVITLQCSAMKNTFPFGVQPVLKVI